MRSNVIDDAAILISRTYKRATMCSEPDPTGQSFCCIKGSGDGRFFKLRSIHQLPSCFGVLQRDSVAVLLVVPRQDALRSPYILCLSLAAHVRIPPPFGQTLPLPDFLLAYFAGHSTFYACCFGGLFWCSASSWRYCWLLAALCCALATARRCCALSRLEWEPQQRPPQPLLTLIHPYMYFFLSKLPGHSDAVHVQRLEPPSLRMPIDIWRKASPDAAASPVLFLIHGGAWRGGEARCSPQAPVLQALAASGFLVVSCEYRRLPGTQWPMQLEDCEAALKWLQDEAVSLGADLSNVSIAGTSAGGHLAALLLARMLHERGELTSSIRFRAALLFYPALDPADRFGKTVKSPFSCSWLGVRRGMSFLAWFFEMFVLRQDRQLWPSAEPLAYLQAASDLEAWPPTLIIHGELDGVVPVEHSRSFLERLAARCAGGTSCSESAGTSEQDSGDLRSCDRLFVVPLARHVFEIVTGDLASASYDAAMTWLSQMQTDGQRKQASHCHVTELVTALPCAHAELWQVSSVQDVEGKGMGRMSHFLGQDFTFHGFSGPDWISHFHWPSGAAATDKFTHACGRGGGRDARVHARGRAGAEHRGYD
ncbi:lipC [Symbiodinium natans]|uniref:LipC protein n=1 Tax=Symbiodinium natans TaxID=878477 RepID=A0A812ID86_9DINO|nr:lipC [Symbiodinium natans]